MFETQFAVMRNLHDAGCDVRTREKFLELYSGGKIEEGVRLLRQHKKALLDDLHASQKKIDCLDFLIFKLQRKI